MVKIRKRDSSLDTMSIGGLHKDDFEWASKQYEAFDYVFVGFVLDVDGYHWKAVYAKAGMLEKNYCKDPLRPSVRLCMYRFEVPRS